MTRYAGLFLALALGQAAEKPVQVVVMDPLALPLSCSCVEGVGQRRYDPLADHLTKVLGRPVELTLDERRDLARRPTGGGLRRRPAPGACVRGRRVSLRAPRERRCHE